MSAPSSAVFAATVFVELHNNQSYCLSLATFSGTVNNNLKKLAIYSHGNVHV